MFVGPFHWNCSILNFMPHGQRGAAGLRRQVGTTCPFPDWNCSAQEAKEVARDTTFTAIPSRVKSPWWSSPAMQHKAGNRTVPMSQHTFLQSRAGFLLHNDTSP